MNKDFKVYLDDMINAINEVEKSTKESTTEDYLGISVNYPRLKSLSSNSLINGFKTGKSKITASHKISIFT